ncbi:MAG: hypothetical protein WCJ46_07870 [bacterium]
MVTVAVELIKQVKFKWAVEALYSFEYRSTHFLLLYIKNEILDYYGIVAIREKADKK